MKHSIFCLICAALAAGTLALSCRKEPASGPEPEPQPEAAYLKVEKTSLTFDYTGGEQTVAVTSNRRAIVSVSDRWIASEFSEVPADGEETSGERHYILKITLAQFNDGREGSVTVSATECEDVTIAITQRTPDKPLSSTCEMTALRLKASENGLNKDLNFTFDKTAKSFSAMYLKWIERESPEMMVPDFVTDGARVTVNGEEVVSGQSRISFADDFTFVVEAENGNTNEYKVSLNCPQINRELPCLHMRPDSRISSTKDYYTPTYIEFYDKTPTSTGTGWWDSATQGKVEMRRRGNSTWDLPKKPFRMKFPEKVQPIGFDHCLEKSWALVANDMDKSLIRNYIAFEYSRIMFVKHQGYHHSKALKFTSIAQPINVYYTGTYPDGSIKGGDYIGVYQFSDQMNKGDGRIDVDKLTAADTDSQLITGGYIMETNIHPDNENHHSQRCNIQMLYKYPEEEDHNSAQYSYISNFIGQAENALYSSSYTDPVNGWRKYFDEKTLADYIIIKELVGDMDGYTSTYFYKRRGVDLLFFGPIWDCDKGWGNDNRAPGWSRDHTCQQLMISAGFGMPGCWGDDWFERVWTDPTFRAFVNNRWKEKKQELLDRTEEILNTLPAQMSKAVKANFSVWEYYYQACNDAPLPARTYEDEIERIRSLTKERAALLDREFAK